MIYSTGLFARLGCVALLYFAGASTSASAAVSIFSDKSAFLSATGATSATGPLPATPGGTVPGGTVLSMTVGSVTFTAGHSVICGGPGTMAFGDFSERLTGNEIAICDKEHLNMDLASPVLALGFDFVEPKNDPNVNAPFVDSTFTVSLRNDSVLVGSFTYNVPEDVASFVGVVSGTAFNRVEIRETVGGIENEFWGQVYTAGTAAQQCLPPPAGLVSWWPGDGNANDIQDGNAGTLQNGATFAAGMIGQAFSFDGIDDRVIVDNAANLNFSTGTSFTIDLWFNTTGPVGGADAPALLDKRKEDGDGYTIAISQGKVSAILGGPTFGFGNPSPALFVTSLSPLADGQWHHVAMVVNRTAQTLQLFIDGISQGPSILGDGVNPGIPSGVPASASFTNSARLMIGHQTIDFGPGFITGLDPYFGLIDDVEIYNRALSPEEIQDIFDAGSAGKCKGVPVIALDHFKCYEAEGDPVNVTVNLQDQFGIEPQVLVGKPKLFCNPVDKNGERIKNPTEHLTCYEIEDEGKERAVRIENQFGEQTLKVEKPELLCVPSKKISVVPSEDDDDDDEKTERKK